MSKARLVTTPAALNALVPVLEGADAIALDMEGDNQHGYEDRGCLVEVEALGASLIKAMDSKGRTEG